MSPPRLFSPPASCPNPRCDSRTKSTPWRYKKKGFFFRDQRPHRIQRYLCHHCGRNFSSQTFDVSYWLRDGQLLESARHFLPPYFLLQTSSASALTNRLLELGVRTGQAELGYEGAIEELEGIIDRIEQGEIGLEASLAELRRGTELHKRCRQILEAAEQELERITAEQRQSAEAEPDEPGEPA